MFFVRNFGRGERFPDRTILAALGLLLAGACSAAAQTSGIPSSQDFGSVTVGSSSATATLTFTPSGISAAPSFSLSFGLEFSAGTPSCSSSGTISCTLGVKFSPQFSGVREDAVIVKDHSGNFLGATFLHGIGLGPQMALTPGIITTIAGTAGTLTLFNPSGVAVDTAGNVYIADSFNDVIRKKSSSGGSMSIVAGTGAPGGFSGDGGAATSATLNNPTGVALDGAGNLYIADQANGRIREVNAVTGNISTVAGGGNPGTGTDSYGDGGPATNAILSGPNDVAVDAAGNLYIADSFHGLVRKVTAATGIITIVAGGGSGGGSDGVGDGDAAANAILHNPTSVAVDAAGDVYIADNGDCMIRRVDATSGIITAVAGDGTQGYSGDLGPATSAELNSPMGIRVDAAGDLYISDFGANVIREVNTSGIINTVAGTGSTGYSGDTGSATNAAIASPLNLALDSAGNLYIADSINNVIRKVSVTSSALVFSAVNVGQASPTQFVTVSDIGTQTLNLSALTVTANFRQQTSGYTDCTSSSAIVSGSDCFVAIASVPSTSGPLTGPLTLTGNSLNHAGTSETAALSGTGNNGSVPVVSISPSSLSFGNQTVGTVSGSKAVTLSNTGTASLSILSIALTGVNSADFGITTTCGSALAVNTSCTVTLTFTPGAAGARSASLMFTDSVASSPQSVSLTGTGVSQGSPTVTLNPSSLSFGNQTVGTVSALNTVTLSNTGTASLSITSITRTGTNSSDFAWSTTCGNALAVNTSCTVTVTFTPGAAGARSASFIFTDSAANSPQSVPLTGTGVPTPSSPAAASFNPSSVTFPSQNVGTSSSPVTITLTNSGGTALALSGASLSGANAADFSLTTTCGSTVAPAASCSYSLTFSPSASGTRSASLGINDSASNSPQSIAITGTGATAGSGGSTGNDPSPSLTQVPGALAQIAVGVDGAIWGLNSSSQIFQYNSSNASWTLVPGSFSRIVVGSSMAVWGLNASGMIFSRDVSAGSWNLIPGALAQMAIGCDGDLWGLNSAQSIYHFDAASQNWEQIPGTLAQLAVGSDGEVWGINAGNSVYRYSQSTGTFSQVPGTLTQIAVGADGDTWGLDNQSIFHFERLSQTFTPMAGSLKQITVGSGGNVYGLNASNQICQYNAQSQSCTWIPGALTQIAAGGNGAVWGLDSLSRIWTLNQPTQAAGVFHTMPGNLSQIAVASDGSAWALNAAGAVFEFNSATGAWIQIPGNLTQISIASGGVVWGLNSGGQIFRFNPSTQSWTWIPGALSQIAVGANGDVWGLNSSGQIFSFNSSSQSWTWIPGALSQISVGGDGTLWGLNSAGQSYRFDPSTHNWQWISGTFSQIAVGSSNNVWGLGPQGQIYQFNSQAGSWKQIPGALTRIAAALDGAVWGINSAHSVYRFNSQTNGWEPVTGSLAQIEIASDAVVWGLDSGGSVYRFQ